VASNSIAWIDPLAIDSAKALEWIAKSVAKGQLQGKHRSQRLSSGYEFSQYRPYVQGDDLRLIDWKMYAKTDKYYIKQSDVERDHDLHCIIDNSRSMMYEENNWSKLLFAKLLTACITYVIAQQGDAFSWTSTDQRFPNALGMQHWKNSIHALHQLSYSDGSLNSELNPESNKVYLWLTDLYQDLNDIRSKVNSLKHNNTELIVFHLIGEQEESLDFGNNTTFIDLENEQKVQMNPKEYLKEYREKLDAHMSACKKVFYGNGINYQKAYINQPIQMVLRSFLESYNKSLI